ncbi:unnamed protein product [Merluccius merluccius]
MIQGCTNQIKALEFTSSLEETAYGRHDATYTSMGPVSPKCRSSRLDVPTNVDLCSVRIALTFLRRPGLPHGEQYGQKYSVWETASTARSASNPTVRAYGGRGLRPSSVTRPTASGRSDWSLGGARGLEVPPAVRSDPGILAAETPSRRERGRMARAAAAPSGG